MEDASTIRWNDSTEAPASSPSTIWISMSPGIDGRDHGTDCRVRRQAAKSSSKARLLTISQRSNHRKRVTGSIVWDSSNQPAPTALRNKNRPNSPNDCRSPFGILRKQTRSDEDEVYSLGRRHRLLWFNPLDVVPIDKNFRHLIHHFMQHFAPEPLEGRSLRGREALRLELWPAMMESPPLLSSMLLVLGTHYNLCVFADPGIQNVDALTLKASAFSKIQSALATSPSGFSNAYNVGAIALMAGWELEYGDPAVYDLHMRFLKSTIQALGIHQITDASLSEQCKLPRVISQLLANVGFELAVYASRQPFVTLLNTSSDIIQSPPAGSSNWPSSFISALSQHTIVPRLLQLLVQLRGPFDISLESFSTLSTIFKQLKAWDPYKVTGSAYCAFQTQVEDDANAQAHYSLRAAGLAMCWSIWHELQTQFDQPCGVFGWNSCAETFDLDHFTVQCSQWQPDALIGTVFEDMTTWALFMTCLVSVDLDRRFQVAEGVFESLRAVSARSALRNGITTATSINDTLQRYVVPFHWSNLLGRCKALVEQLELGQNGWIPSVAFNRHNAPAPRYDRRVQYPLAIVEPERKTRQSPYCQLS